MKILPIKKGNLIYALNATDYKLAKILTSVLSKENSISSLVMFFSFCDVLFSVPGAPLIDMPIMRDVTLLLLGKRAVVRNTEWPICLSLFVEQLSDWSNSEELIEAVALSSVCIRVFRSSLLISFDRFIARWISPRSTLNTVPENALQAALFTCSAKAFPVN